MVAVEPVGGLAVGVGVGRGDRDGQVERDPDLPVVAGLAVGPNRLAVRQQRVVDCAERGRPVADTGSLDPVGVAEDARHPRLVVGDPGGHDVAEGVEDDPGVLGEALDDVARCPAALVLERLRQVPVVQRRQGLDAALEHSLDERTVEVEAALVGRPAARRLDPWPGDREAVALEPERAHQVEVVPPPVVVLAGRIARVAVGDVALDRRRTGPRSTPRGRLPWSRPRSGTPPWPLPRRTAVSSLAALLSLQRFVVAATDMAGAAQNRLP